MKKMNLLLKKCKSLSRQLGRSSSYSSLRSKSTKEEINNIWGREQEDDEHCETIYVGSTRKRYVISSKYLNHPLLNALIEKRGSNNNNNNNNKDDADVVVVNCEVVLFDHLLWMLENADPKISSESLEELVQLYVF